MRSTTISCAIGSRLISESRNTTGTHSSGSHWHSRSRFSMSSRRSETNVRVRRSRLTLALIIAVCAAPLIASYLAYYVWRPDGHVNYGELLEPRPVHDVELRRLDGRAFHLSELKGNWVLLTVD